MAGPYTPTGPFVDNTSPGIDHNFLNNIEAWIGQVDNAAATTLSGTTGTVTAYMPFQGPHYKKVLLWLNNFQNTSGSTTALSLPTAFTSGGKVETESLHIIELRVGTSAQTLNIITSIAAAGGATATQTYIKDKSFGYFAAAIDHIGFQSGGSGAITSLVIIEGL